MKAPKEIRISLPESDWNTVLDALHEHPSEDSERITKKIQLTIENATLMRTRRYVEEMSFEDYFEKIKPFLVKMVSDGAYRCEARVLALTDSDIAELRERISEKYEKMPRDCQLVYRRYVLYESYDMIAEKYSLIPKTVQQICEGFCWWLWEIMIRKQQREQMHRIEAFKQKN